LINVRLEHSVQYEFTPPQPRIENVIVRGRKPLSARRREIDVAEGNFTDTWNNVNSRDDFDMQCRYEAPTGSRMRQRVCTPVYHNRSTRLAAQDFLRGGGHIQQVEASRVHILERQLSTEMRDRAFSDPELREQRETLDERWENYNDALEERGASDPK
jgi:hypothetical protein